MVPLSAADTGLLHTFDSNIQFALASSIKRMLKNFSLKSLLLLLQISCWPFSFVFMPSCAAYCSPLYADSGGEMASISSDILDSSTVQKNPMDLGSNPSKTRSPVQEEEYALSNDHSDSEPSLCIAVIGATGELARSKVFPALFALFYSGFLPRVWTYQLLLLKIEFTVPL